MICKWRQFQIKIWFFSKKLDFKSVIKSVDCSQSKKSKIKINLDLIGWKLEAVDFGSYSRYSKGTFLWLSFFLGEKHALRASLASFVWNRSDCAICCVASFWAKVTTIKCHCNNKLIHNLHYTIISIIEVNYCKVCSNIGDWKQI